MLIGHVSLALENEVGGTWGHEINFIDVKRWDVVCFGCNNLDVPK